MKKTVPRREFWSKLIREVDAGAAVDVVAKRHGVRPKTLSFRRWQLGRARKALTSPRWIPVAVRQAPPIAQTSTSLCVVLPACELRVGVGTDPSYVGKLVASLRAC